MRPAVTSSTPPSAAMGIRDTKGPSSSITSSSTTAWETDASRVRAPDRTLTAVRAMAPVATTIAISDSGRCRKNRWPTRCSAMTPAATTSGCQARVQSVAPSVSHDDTSVDSASPRSVPRISGSCCSPMMTPMPMVNPSTTETGMNSTARPTAVSAMAMTRRPARMASSGTVATPCLAITGSSTTVMAPVGPDTCRWLPPNTAATTPATMAVTSPAAAPTPGSDPEAERQRQGHDADRHAGEQVLGPGGAQPRVIAPRRPQAGDADEVLADEGAVVLHGLSGGEPRRFDPEIPVAHVHPFLRQVTPVPAGGPTRGSAAGRQRRKRARRRSVATVVPITIITTK